MKINILFALGLLLAISCKVKSPADAEKETLKVSVEITPEGDNSYSISWEDTIGMKHRYGVSNRPIELWCHITDSKNDTIGYYRGLSTPRTFTYFETTDTIVKVIFSRAFNFFTEAFPGEKERREFWEKNKTPIEFKSVEINLKTQLRQKTEYEIEQNKDTSPEMPDDQAADSKPGEPIDGDTTTKQPQVKNKMQPKKTISLTEFKTVVGEIAKETRNEFSNRFFDYAGMIPNDEKNSRYDCAPTNTRVFAHTGGDGVHYSILEISREIQPVVMTVPMNFGSSMKSYNWVIAENLNEFLSLGYYNGWFPLEQLCYDNDWVIKFYASENKEDDYQSGGDIQFVKKLRKKIGYDHIPLNNQRLKDLENKYFGQLQFKSEFVEMISKRKD